MKTLILNYSDKVTVKGLQGLLSYLALKHPQTTDFNLELIYIKESLEVATSGLEKIKKQSNLNISLEDVAVLLLAINVEDVKDESLFEVSLSRASNFISETLVNA